MKLTQRQLKLLQCFSNNEWLTSTQLANELQVSSRTVRDEIKIINRSFNNEIISMEKGKGYILKREFTSVQSIIEVQTLDDDNDNIRKTNILKVILNNDDVNFYDLADKFYISESKLNTIINEFNIIIGKKYPTLQIIRKNNKILPPSKESDKRKILSCFLIKEVNNFNFDIKNYNNFFSACDLTSLQNFVIQFNQTNNLNMRSFEIFSFVLHIAIILERVKNNQSPINNEAISTNSKADALANKFYRELNLRFDITLPENEIKQISLLFSGSIAIFSVDIINKLSSFIDDLLESVKNNYSFDLTDNTKIKDNLLVHLLGLESRIKASSFLINPLIADIKKHFPLIYDISVYMALKIQDYYHCVLPEDEIGYITLHLMNDVDRYQKKYKREIILITSLGSTENKYISNRLISLSNKLIIEISDTYSFFDAGKCADKEVDLIISTIPINFKTKSPIYVCNHLLTDTDLKKIYDLLINDESNEDISHFFDERLYFYDLDLKNENDIICYLCHQLNNLGYCGKDYVNKVLKRENLAPTTYGNLFAIPHPIEKVAYENKIAIAILKDNVQWQDKKVKLILLFSLSPNKDKSIEDIFEKLIVLLNDINIVKNLTKQKNLKDFLKVFLNE